MSSLFISLGLGLFRVRQRGGLLSGESLHHRSITDAGKSTYSHTPYTRNPDFQTNSPAVFFSNLQKMPEEDAFCVFVRLMYDYKLRDLFKPSMADLGLCFFQLERLVEVRVHPAALINPLATEFKNCIDVVIIRPLLCFRYFVHFHFQMRVLSSRVICCCSHLRRSIRPCTATFRPRYVWSTWEEVPPINCHFLCLFSMYVDL